MSRLEFSYSSQVIDQADQEMQDGGIISFVVDFDQELDSDGFRQACYSVAMDEVISILAEKYGDSIYDDLPDVSIRITGLTVT